MPAHLRPVPNPGFKDCLDCKIEKALTEFPRNVRGSQDTGSYCNLCMKVRRAERYQQDPAYSREKQQGYRRQALAALGGCCVRCGNDDPRVLDIDHVHGDGGQERAVNRHAHIPRVIAEPESGRYQLLCANCHRIKTYESGDHLPRTLRHEAA